MDAKVITIGEILAEIVAVVPGHGFLEPIELCGPFPSGAPAIFIDQLAKQGTACGMIGCVGNDDFGRLNLERLRRDGADIAAIQVHPDAPTGTAFVRYRPDGERDFVFNVRHSASGHIRRTPAVDYAIATARHIHIMGTSLASQDTAALVLHALSAIKARGGSVSFDPNMRAEMLSSPGLRPALASVLKQTDLYLPSGPEALLLSGRSELAEAVRDALALGVKAMVVKLGSAGARYFDASSEIAGPAFQIDEVDPTGAGDIFGATFLAGWLKALPPQINLMRANAAGALAVLQRGPMEGTSTPSEIDLFLSRARS